MYSDEPATQPLNGIIFQLYLQKHGLSPLKVASAAGVRYMTLWRMMHALPIQSKNDLLIRCGLYRLTGKWYRGPIVVYQETR